MRAIESCKPATVYRGALLMNTYRVRFTVNNSARVLACDVDATRPGAAISRALKHFDVRANSIDATCRIFARDVERDWTDFKVRTVSE